MKSLTFSKGALQALRRMPANTATSIRSKIGQYAREPASLANNVTKLQGREGCRLRVGSWRIIFKEDEAAIRVVSIGPRGGVYD